MIPLPPVLPGPGWSAGTSAPNRIGEQSLTLRRDDGTSATVALQRCVAGRLRAAYPVGAHDVEIRIDDNGTPLGMGALTEMLAEIADAVLSADVRCRRVVFAAPATDHDQLTAAEAAGFRHVVDVDVPGAELALLTAEPAWVTAVDIDLDRVPGS